MAIVQHSALAGSSLHQPYNFEQATDPGAIGDGGYWLDTSHVPYGLRRRNATDDGWVGVSGSGMQNVRDFGAVGDGIHNDTGPIQAAINALVGIGGTVFLPVGTYKTVAPLVIDGSGINLLGADRHTSRIQNDVSTLIALTGTGSYGWTWEHLTLWSSAGHVIDAQCAIASDSIVHCELVCLSAGHSIFHQDNDFDYVNILVFDCDLTGADNAIVSPWYVRTTSGLNDNYWMSIVANHGNNPHVPFFHIESANPEAYAVGNVFRDIIGEQCASGIARLLGVNGAEMSNVHLWDADTYHGDIVFIGSTPGGVSSSSVMVRMVSRHGTGIFPTGLYDVNVDKASMVVIDSCDNAVSAMPAQIRVGESAGGVTLLNMIDAELTDGDGATRGIGRIAVEPRLEITGSRASGAALVSLLDQLAALGLILDSSVT